MQNCQLCINEKVGGVIFLAAMAHDPTNEMRLYDKSSRRLYLNRAELTRFLAVAHNAPPPQRAFALTLAYTGMRLSEARMLRAEDVQLSERVLSVRTLKKRQQQSVRELPMPLALVGEMSEFCGHDRVWLWEQCGRPLARITAYRWIKALMADAELSGPKACPKGLRHAYGTRAVLSGVPLHMLQRWLGHGSMETTAIYATVIGDEQLELCDAMWRAQDGIRYNSRKTSAN